MINDYSSNDYAGIDLIPNHSELQSRSKASCAIKFGPKTFKLPVLPANMTCCINTNLAKWLSENDYFYIMHRFDGNQNPKDLRFFIEKANKEGWKNISISVGVNEEDYQLIEWIGHNRYRVDYITIDIAHGHQTLTDKMIKHIRCNEFDDKYFIIAGNVSTSDAVTYLSNCGADAVKAGIGGGAACTTRLKTGFHVPMFKCALDCCIDSKIPIIIDGGIRHNGDFAKALVAGFQNKNNINEYMVMAGSIFASCKDSPAKITNDGYLKWLFSFGKIKQKSYKCYYGSASYQNGNDKNIEGTLIKIPMNAMTYKQKLQEIKEDLSSAISYAGGKDLTCFKNVKWTER